MHYVVVRNDLDPETSRSARPLLVHRTIEESGRLVKVAQFGEPVGPGTLAGFITDSGLRPRYPAVEIYKVDGSPGMHPYIVDTDAMVRIDERMRRCCASTNAAGCGVSRRWGRCC